MWFSKDSVGFNGGFIVLDSSNNFKTGLPSSSFTVTIVNPSDTATYVPTVTESAVLPGLYRFFIPPAFLLANGIGDYPVVVQVDTSGTGGPVIRRAFTELMDVAEKDFNDIAGATTITDIQNSLNNVENTVNDVEIAVNTLYQTMVSDQFTVVGTTAQTPGAIVTDSTLPDGTFDGQLAVLVSSIGTTPVILARTIVTNTGGTFTVSPDYPFAPSDGDQLIILARTATAAVDNNAIATAVWTVVSSPSTPGTYGELVNIIGNRSSLIPGLV